MSKQLYKKYLNVVKSWPRDKYKNPQRDLSVFLLEETEKAFSPTSVPLDSLACERKLKALELILSNRWLKEYPHNYKSGVFGLKLKQLEEASSDEVRKQFGLAPRFNIFKKLFNSFLKPNPTGK